MWLRRDPDSEIRTLTEAESLRASVTSTNLLDSRLANSMNRDTITESAARLRSRTLTATELVNRCLQTIDALEPQVRAWVCLDREQALAVAKECDAEQSRGQFRGPLHGIPIGVKDIVDVRGFPTRAGSPLTSDKPVAKDAAVVARLRAAGAIVLGKTVTTEYASFDPPPTRNPWNLQHTPGGSSSGSAAAVAVGMCLGSVGTQTGGSIIRPASYCGVYGFKPSFDRLPLEGVIPLSQPLDHIGPMARSVADLRLMFDGMSGTADKQSPAEAPQSTPPRIALVESFFMEQADKPVAGLIRDQLSRLRAAGATVTSVDLPSSFAEVHARHLVLMAHGATKVHRDQFASHGDKYGREISSLLNKGLAIDEATFLAALEHQRGFRSAMNECFANADILITPATPTPAPTKESTGDPKFNSPWSYSGLPSVSIPCGISESDLPLCLQLIGQFGSDNRLLSAAEWVEQQVKFDWAPAL